MVKIHVCFPDMEVKGNSVPLFPNGLAIKLQDNVEHKIWDLVTSLICVLTSNFHSDLALISEVCHVKNLTDYTYNYSP